MIFIFIFFTSITCSLIVIITPILGQVQFREMELAIAPQNVGINLEGHLEVVLQGKMIYCDCNLHNHMYNPYRVMN